MAPKYFTVISANLLLADDIIFVVKSMYKNSHDLWDGDTVNKSSNSAEIFLGMDSSKVKSSGGNNLSHDTNNVA